MVTVESLNQFCLAHQQNHPSLQNINCTAAIEVSACLAFAILLGSGIALSYAVVNSLRAMDDNE